MTALQQALKGIEAPKVTQREISQLKYNPAKQEVAQVNQTNYAGQLTGIMQAGAQLYDTHVKTSLKEAQTVYDHAKAQGIDPMEAAKQKAKEESETLIGGAIHAVQTGFGVDPLRYARAVTASNQAKEQMFDIDTEIETKIARGDFNSMEELVEYRNNIRVKTIEAVAESTGTASNDPFLLEGAAKYNTQSLEALTVRQARATEEMLVASNQRTFNSEVNNLLTTDVRNPVAYEEMFAQARRDGVVRNDNEEWTARHKLLNAVVERGDTALLNGLMNQTVTFNGQTGVLGEMLEPAVRDQLMLKADEHFIQKNKEVFAEFNKQLTHVSVMSMQGDAASAMAALNRTQQWLEQYQGSGQVTTQVRQIEALRAQVVENQVRYNVAQAQRNTAAVDKTVAVNSYADRIDRALAGDLVALDHTDIQGVDKEIQDMAFMAKFEAINGNDDLSPEQKQQAVYALAAVAPKTSELHAAIQRSVDAGFGSFEASMAQIAVTGPKDMPPQFQALMKMYKDNPTGFSQVATPEQTAKMAATAYQIDALGWETFSTAASKAGADKETLKEIDAELADLQASNNLTDVQVNTLRTASLAYLPTTKTTGFWGGSKTSTSRAIEMAQKQLSKSVTTIGNDVVSNKALAPRGNAEEIPVVQKALESKVAALRSANPDFMYSVQDDNQGNLLIIEYPTGITRKTTAVKLYDSQFTAQVQPEVDRMKALEEAMKKRGGETALREERLKKVQAEGYKYGTQPNDKRNAPKQ